MIIIDQSKKCQEVDLSPKADELEVLFATGIVNPNGPTFNVFYLDAISSSESKPLYQVTIHPISDSIQNVGTVTFGTGSRRTIIEIRFYSDFFNGSLPTLFMKGHLLYKEIFEKIISLYIDSTDDGLRTYQYIKQYEGKPYQRVSAEMRGAFESILGKKEEQKAGFLKNLFGKRNKEINQVDNQDFINVLTKEVNVIEEIKALFMAYNGSIENVIPAAMVQLDFKAFINVFTHVAIQCNIDLDKLRK